MFYTLCESRRQKDGAHIVQIFDLNLNISMNGVVSFLCPIEAIQPF